MNKYITRDFKIRVFIIEDEALIIHGLKSIFSLSKDKIKVLGEAYNLNDALVKLSIIDFDIILLDLWLAKGDPVENVKKLKEKYEAKPIVILTSEDFDEWKQKMYELGVSAYILKSSEPWEIESVLYEVAQGKYIIDHSPIPRGKIARYSFLRTKFDFTKFQVELINLLSEGNNLKQIAGIMNKSVSCINKELKKIKKICCVTTTIELLYTILN